MLSTRYYCCMSSWVPELIRRQEEPVPDTLKRVLGASIILLVALQVPNKQGWTVPFALTMSDALGPYVRSGCGSALDFITERQHNEPATLAANTQISPTDR